MFDRILKVGEGRKLKAVQGLVPDINALEPEIEALSDDDQMWADEMIREWMKQTDPYTKRQRAHFDRPLHRRKQ